MDTLAEVAPPILIACAGELLDTQPMQAGDTYQMLLDQYPDHALADQARQGIDDAELLDVRRLLAGWPDLVGVVTDMPYCDDPAPYSLAPPYTGPGPHRVVDANLPVPLPAGWQATDFTDAVLVLCAELGHGARVGTCEYYVENWYDYPELTSPHLTPFLLARKYRMVAYELRTGAVVAEEVVETGSSCPPFPTPFRSFPAFELADDVERDTILAVIEPLVNP